MRDFKHIKAIICDWDDTKVSTFNSVYPLWCRFAKSESIQAPTQEKLKLLWGRPLKGMIVGLWPNENVDVLEKIFYNFLRKEDFIIKPFPYTQDTVLKLKDMGYILGIISSAPRNVINKTLDRYFNLPDDVYHFIHAAEDCIAHKPDPRVFENAFKALKKVSIREKHSIYVGDGLNDFEVSQARGVPFIAVTTGFITKEAFLHAGVHADDILDTFEDLPKLLKNTTE